MERKFYWLSLFLLTSLFGYAHGMLEVDMCTSSTRADPEVIIYKHADTGFDRNLCQCHISSAGDISVTVSFRLRVTSGHCDEEVLIRQNGSKVLRYCSNPIESVFLDNVPPYLTDRREMWFAYKNKKASITGKTGTVRVTLQGQGNQIVKVDCNYRDVRPSVITPGYTTHRTNIISHSPSVHYDVTSERSASTSEPSVTTHRSDLPSTRTGGTTRGTDFIPTQQTAPTPGTSTRPAVRSGMGPRHHTDGIGLKTILIIVIAVVMAIAAVVIVAVIIIWCRRRNDKAKDESGHHTHQEPLYAQPARKKKETILNNDEGERKEEESSRKSPSVTESVPCGPENEAEGSEEGANPYVNVVKDLKKINQT